MNNKITLNEYLELATDGYHAGEAFGKLDLSSAIQTTIHFGEFKWLVVTLDGRNIAALPFRAAIRDRGSIYLTKCGSFGNGFMCFATRLHSAGTSLADLLKSNLHGNDLIEVIGKASGRCACCGAILIDPLSIDRGVGPKCIKKLWGSEAAYEAQRAKLQQSAEVN